MAKKNGRPTKFTKKMGLLICDEIRSGKSVGEICKPENMPHKSQIFRWLRMPSLKNFRDQYEQAIQDRTDAWAEEVIDIADTVVMGEITTKEESDDGFKNKVKTEDMVARARLKVDTRLKLMAKLAPKKYGDKLDLSNSDRSLEPVVIFDMHLPPETKKAVRK